MPKKFSDEFKIEALKTVIVCGGNLSKAAVAITAQGSPLTPQALSKWKKERPEEYARLEDTRVEWMAADLADDAEHPCMVGLEARRYEERLDSLYADYVKRDADMRRYREALERIAAGPAGSAEYECNPDCGFACESEARSALAQEGKDDEE